MLGCESTPEKHVIVHDVNLKTICQVFNGHFNSYHTWFQRYTIRFEGNTHITCNKILETQYVHNIITSAVVTNLSHLGRETEQLWNNIRNLRSQYENDILQGHVSSCMLQAAVYIYVCVCRRRKRYCYSWMKRSIKSACFWYSRAISFF